MNELTNTTQSEEEHRMSLKSRLEMATSNLTEKDIRMQECFDLMQMEENSAKHVTLCRRVWDTILCWPPVPPNTTAVAPCSEAKVFEYNGTARRYCLSDGSWFANGIPDAEESGTGWSNYTECAVPNTPSVPHLMKVWLPIIKKTSVIGYSISLFFLVISFALLFKLRRLRCPRNVLHLHLFASFMLKASFVLIKGHVTHDYRKLSPSPPSSEHVELLDSSSFELSWCKLLVVIWQYFIVANYSMIFMEGLYLHNLIFMALFTDSSDITLYVVLGWVVPLLLVTVWAILRLLLDNFHCWTVNKSQWIFWLCIRSPVALSNFLNFFFFLNVMRVLFLKLRSSTDPDSMKYRKLGKSTLVLVPLFGIHYFALWGLSTSSNDKVELAWLFLDQVFASFQGFFVALLYCLLNGEVLQELRRIRANKRDKRHSLPSLANKPRNTLRKNRPGQQHSTVYSDCRKITAYEAVPTNDQILNSPNTYCDQNSILNNGSNNAMVHRKSENGGGDMPEEKTISDKEKSSSAKYVEIQHSKGESENDVKANDELETDSLLKKGVYVTLIKETEQCLTKENKDNLSLECDGDNHPKTGNNHHETTNHRTNSQLDEITS